MRMQGFDCFLHVTQLESLESLLGHALFAFGTVKRLEDQKPLFRHWLLEEIETQSSVIEQAIFKGCC